MSDMRPKLPPGITVCVRTPLHHDGEQWITMSAGGEILTPRTRTRSEAVAQAWLWHASYPDPWVAYADVLEAENAELRKRADAGDEARRVLDLLRKSDGAEMSGPRCHDPITPWRFECVVKTTAQGHLIWADGTGDTPEAAILAALEVKP